MAEPLPAPSQLLPRAILVEHRFNREKASFPAWFCLSAASLSELEAVRGSFLGPSDEDYLGQLRFEKRRRTYLLGRFCAKECLAAFLDQPDRTGFEVIPGVFGQPVVVGNDIQNAQVSISHGEGLAVAVAFRETHPLAVDIEEITPNRTQTIRSQLSNAEINLLSKLPGDPDAKAMLAWTAKEALSKVLKTGLMTPMSVYEIESVDWDSGCHLSVFKSFGQYKAIGFVAGRFALSIVLPRRSQLACSLIEFRNSLSHPGAL